MKRFDSLLEEAVSGYEGEFSEIICETPVFCMRMIRLLDDPDLPRQLSQACALEAPTDNYDTEAS